jgi:hypothetical protein
MRDHYQGCFTTTVRRAAEAGAVAIVARQAAAKTKVVAIWMIITTALYAADIAV